ncbi:enoyl-CoA hydratase [Bacillus sp. AGMB 02131]|uniref:Enoyl-CoA hydratase n=1 Tax=Peribacillus faecalis TaxID=2772559 RepID=A0A927H9W6_9BACI|nr:enoyl-CoA hydratase [Peribacillus faecalis]MBD3107319.1 enoyl-CoA hydratase [Peribacillus faecalis]
MTLVTNEEEAIVTITLNRPKAANALSRDLLEELKATFINLRSNRHVRCIIITGRGHKVFSAGADLKERKELPESSVRNAVSLIGDTLSVIESMPQPVIASVNGLALGGGFELALACDLRIASTNAKFALPETSLGIIPGAGGTQRLPRLIGVARAKELIFTGRRLNCIEAEELGLITKAVSVEELPQETLLLARSIIKNAPIALAEAKKAIHYGMETDLHTGLKIEEWCYDATIPTMDRLEGLRAFAEKRQPEFKGK